MPGLQQAKPRRISRPSRGRVDGRAIYCRTVSLFATGSIAGAGPGRTSPGTGRGLDVTISESRVEGCLIEVLDLHGSG
jgi:hypothetical protein